MRHPLGERFGLLIGVILLLLSGEAHAERLLAVLPLDVRMTKGKMDQAAQSSIEEMLRDVATNLLTGDGWTILTGETTLQVLEDNGVDAAKCSDQSCHLSMAREIKAEKFLSGTVQYVDGEFTASIRLIDTRTGRILASERVSGKNTKALREMFERRAEQFFLRAGLQAPPTGEPTNTKEKPVATPSPKPQTETRPAASEKRGTVSLADVGLDASAMDRTVDPCTDFYQFACGGWLKSTQIPADRMRWTRSFNEINERKRNLVRDVLEQAARNQASDPVSKKIGGFYASCMDETSIEAAGLGALEPLLRAARNAKDKASLQRAIFEFHRYNVPVLFDLDAGQDSKDATKMIALLSQAGLGLPDQGYYLSTGEREKKIRDTYVAHIERMLTLAGDKPSSAKSSATEILAFETELAKLSQSRAERNDPAKSYNRVNLTGLRKAAPAFPWDDYFKALQHGGLTDISVNSVPYFEGLSKLFTTTSFSTWQSYLRWHALHALAPALPAEFTHEDFVLKQALTGLAQPEPRWKRCVDATETALGDLLGQAFSARAFTESSKVATKTIAMEISEAFGRNVKNVDWLDEETRRRVEDKRKSVSFLIGYPDRWKEYHWEVNPKDYAANTLAWRQHETQRVLDRVGRPVDRGDWYMSATTVNAYYDPQKNQLVFPAAILQPPFYSPRASLAVNMGGIGMVIGHEFTHGFDDGGSQYDTRGNLHAWWEPGVNARFAEKSQCVEEQYASYEAAPGVSLNGKLTLGENVADNAGAKLAFAAYRNMRKDSTEKIVADGFNEDQQFFLSMGQAWCTLSRPDDATSRVKYDPHSPPKWRVNGPLSNMPEFAAAFSCKYGSPMRARNQCVVW